MVADCGTIFKLTSPQAPGMRWSWTLLYGFDDRQIGVSPDGGLALGEDGSLYATNTNNGSPDDAFKLTPGSPGELWTKTILHAFGARR